MDMIQKRIGKQIICSLILSLMILCSIRPNTVFAASATVGFEIEDGGYMVDDQITVTLTVNTDANLGDFEGNIIYNSAVLEYVQGPSCIAGGYGMLRIEDMDASSSWSTRSYIMTFKAIGAGECEFAFVDAPVAYEYESGDAMSVSATTKSISIASAPEASSNAELASIKVGNFTLTPTFDSAVTSYSVIVDSTTTQLILSAVPADLKAKVEVSGNENFQEGNNEITILVTSELGKTKQYAIHVQKEEREMVTLPAAQEEEQAVNVQASLEGGITLIQGSFEYTVVPASDEITIPSGYVKTSIKVSGYTVPVYQLAANVDDDYLLLVLQNQFGQTNLYRYDRLEKTIQRYTGDRVIIQDNSDNTELEISKLRKTYDNKIGKKNLFIVVLSGLVVFLIIGVIILYLRTKGIQEDDFY